MTLFWTHEREETLRKLVADGKSAAEIGREIGISRDAVLGKILRMGMRLRRAPGDGTGMRRSNSPHVARAPKAPLVSPPPPVEPHVTMMTVSDRTCRFPYGDPRDDDFYFCGHPPKPGHPYCAGHCAEASRGKEAT